MSSFSIEGTSVKFMSYVVFTFSQFLDFSFDVKWDNSGAKLD